MQTKYVCADGAGGADWCRAVASGKPGLAIATINPACDVLGVQLHHGAEPGRGSLQSPAHPMHGLNLDLLSMLGHGKLPIA